MEILSRKTAKELSQQRLETYQRFTKVIQWGRKHPIEFSEIFLGAKMMDLQKYAIYNSWNRQFLLWLKCRNGGKSTDIALYVMLRSLLLPYHTTYILGNTGAQAKETFLKMEKIAKREIESFVGLTDVFLGEIQVSGTTGEGFVHDPASYKARLFNGAEIFTLNSDIINIKGKRANLVCFDESGWFSDELYLQAEQFVNQDSDFKLGGNVDIQAEPRGFPRQLLYASSASDTSSGFYRKARMFTERMMMGDPNYFVCDFDIDAILSATVDGDPIPIPLISKDKVEQALADNHEKAMRELYNRFSADAHEGQILTRRNLRQCTKPYLPMLLNEGGTHLMAFAWDSARLNDNSVIVIAELIDDPVIGWKMRVMNVVSLVDVDTKKRTPMRLPEQVEEFKKLLLLYNGAYAGKLDYENIDVVLGDSGSGGQIIGGFADYMLDAWMGEDKKKHKGIIDRTHKANETARIKYPDAVDIVRLIDPRANRNAIFKALEEMVKLGVVEFPAEYDGKEYVVYIDEDGNEIKKQLSIEEQIALSQIEMLKTEAVTMCKYISGGNVTYNYPADKRNIMHDDRVYAMGLLCFYLVNKRRGQIINRQADAPYVWTPTVSTVDFDL